MARRPDLEVDLKDDDDGPDPLELAIEQCGAGGSVEVQRRAPEGGRRQYIGRLDVDGFDLELVRQTYGGGDYGFRFKDRHGKIRASGESLIAGPAKPGDLDPKAKDDDAEDAGPDPRQLVDQLREEQRGLAETIRELKAGASGNPLEQTLTMLTLLERLRPPVAPPTGRDPVEAFLQGAEFARGMMGEGGGGGGNITERALGGLTHLIERYAGQNPDGFAGRSPVTPIRTDMVNPRALWPSFIGPYLPTLLQWAEERRNPELRAELVLEEVPAGMLGPVLGELEREGFLEEFFRAVPDAAPHREWFTGFVQALRDQLAPDAEGGEDDGSE